MEKNKSTRREFIQMASAVAASVTTGCLSDEFVDNLAKKGKKPSEYPVVVIGSGLGGLASAVYLSKAGFPVTVIEQHSVPGGYATAFQRGNFTFDVSLHFFGVMEDLYAELGLEGKVERIPIPMTRRVVLPGKNIIVPEMKEKSAIQFMCDQFPREKEGIRGYYTYCLALYDELMKFSKTAESGYIFIPLMPFRYPKMWEIRNKTCAEVLAGFVKDPAVRSAMAGNCGVFGLPPSRVSGFMTALFDGIMMKSRFYYFRSRSQDLSNAFASIIKEHNGTLLFNKSVNKILTRENTVTGVQTEDGATYPAKIVVSNANAPDTFGKFLSHNEEAKNYMRKLSGYKPSISSFVIWLGLKGDVTRKIPEQSVSIPSGLDIETDYENYLKCDADRVPVWVTLYDNYFKGYSRPGTSTLTIMILSGYEPWRRFEKDYFAGNKEAYDREKTRVMRTLIRRVEEKAIPGLSSMIQVMEAATPLTNMRFTRNPGGAIYGFPPSVDNAYVNRIRNSTPIQGLYLSSGWGNNSGSYAGGIMNGRDVYRLIMKEM